MKTSKTVTSFFVLLALSSVALVGAAEDSALGLRPLGDARIGPVVDQRFDVTNLGSSGEDGVEIGASSAFGGGAAVHLDALLHTPGATCHVEQNGRDGVSYGSIDVLARDDGTGEFAFDYSGLGATAVHVVEYDERGNITSDEAYPGPAGKYWQPTERCPNGDPPIAVMQWTSSQLCTTCPACWVLVWICPGGSTFSYERTVVVNPILPTDAPDLVGVESVSITAQGLPSLTISEAASGSFDGRP